MCCASLAALCFGQLHLRTSSCGFQGNFNSISAPDCGPSQLTPLRYQSHFVAVSSNAASDVLSLSCLQNRCFEKAPHT